VVRRIVDRYLWRVGVVNCTPWECASRQLVPAAKAMARTEVGSRAATAFSLDISQNRQRVASVSSAIHSQEIVMPSSQLTPRISRFAFAAASTLGSLSWTGAALASQGPGGGLGTASPLTQVTMAVIVWGISALVLAAGLVGAVRQHRH
jgi:hypothetical protein